MDDGTVARKVCWYTCGKEQAEKVPESEAQGMMPEGMYLYKLW